jgi:hypothetical protein
VVSRRNRSSTQQVEVSSNDSVFAKTGRWIHAAFF